MFEAMQMAARRGAPETLANEKEAPEQPKGAERQVESGAQRVERGV
jgi:hypothetical protein